MLVPPVRTDEVRCRPDRRESNQGRDGHEINDHQQELRCLLRELGQHDALQETDRGAYWPTAATPREPSLNQCGKLISRDDDKLVRVVGDYQDRQWRAGK